MTTRGIRNHNPGNLRVTSDKWQGLAAEQGDKAFFTFQTPAYGIRALARTLIAYQDKHGLRTVQQVIRRWAPPSENDTVAYIASVERTTGFEKNEQLDLHSYAHLRPLVEAIIKHENGQQPYGDAVIDKALVMAGVEPPAKPSRTIRGGQVATVGAAAGAVTAIKEAVDAIQPAVPLVQQFLGAAPQIGIAIISVAALGGIGYMIWARIDDRRKGLRP